MIKDLLKTLNGKIIKNQSGTIVNCIYDMKYYQATDWKKHKPYFFNLDNSLDTPGEKNYYKNIIYQDDAFELILIKWEKGSETSIHEHPDNGCILKLLEGKLKEERYDKFKKYKSSELTVNSVGYMHDNLGAHKIIALEESYSLHLYSPPMYYA